jgi:RNA polymerase sigma-70 factor (ECF subfamily)
MTEPRSTDSERDRVTEALLVEAARGDADAWRSLVLTYAPRVHGLLVAQCRDEELAEEITQSAFCTVAAKLRDYVETGRFESWLFRIAVNRLRDEMRRRARQARPTDDGPMAEIAARSSHRTTAADLELHAMLRRALAQLSEGDREIIELRHTGGMSFKALSDYFEEPLGTLLARHHRALRKLRVLLEEMGVEDLDLGAEGGGG